MKESNKIKLKKIAKEEVQQGPSHKYNIIDMYTIIRKMAANEFTEDNVPTLNHFLKECFEESLKVDIYNYDITKKDKFKKRVILSIINWLKSKIE